MQEHPMLTQADFPNRPAPIAYELRDLLAKWMAEPVFVAAWFDRVRGLQVVPIGDKRAVRSDTMVYQVRGERDVAVLIATKQLLDAGNENGAMPA
jgi:hypothetical protein